MKDAYRKSIKEIYEELNTSENGIHKRNIEALRRRYGRNVLVERDKKTKLQIFLNQFKNIMIILLLVVGVLSLIYAIVTKGDFLEPIVILGTSLVNCFMGFLQESKAEDAMGKLKKYTANYITVKRDGHFKDIDASSLLVGDYIVLESGDKIPADARIVTSYNAKVDESILTGESDTVSKNNITLNKDALISEQKNMVFSGTVLVGK